MVAMAGQVGGVRDVRGKERMRHECIDGSDEQLYYLTDGNNWDRTDFYYTLAWQIVEERFADDSNDAAAVATDVKYQYVWDVRYIDAAVLRDEDTDGDDDCTDSPGSERLYYCQDANFNVTALIETDGDVAERYVYDPYGKVTIYNSNWSSTVTWAASKQNEILFCGYRYDPESGLFHVRHRMHHPTLGRWMQREPGGVYRDGMSLYEYVMSSPVMYVDYTGREAGLGGTMNYDRWRPKPPVKHKWNGHPTPPNQNQQPATGILTADEIDISSTTRWVLRAGAHPSEWSDSDGGVKKVTVAVEANQTTVSDVIHKVNAGLEVSTEAQAGAIFAKVKAGAKIHAGYEGAWGATAKHDHKVTMTYEVDAPKDDGDDVCEVKVYCFYQRVVKLTVARADLKQQMAEGTFYVLEIKPMTIPGRYPQTNAPSCPMSLNEFNRKYGPKPVTTKPTSRPVTTSAPHASVPKVVGVLKTGTQTIIMYSNGRMVITQNSQASSVPNPHLGGSLSE